MTSKASYNIKPKKSVGFDFDQTCLHSYPAPQGEERTLYYPDLTEQETLRELRKQIMHRYVRGSASFKESVEKMYSRSRTDYDDVELSSNEFSLESANADKHVYDVSDSDFRGLEHIYCSVIKDHCKWAVERIVASQRDKTLRKKLPSLAAMVSVRSKNYARLVALGDAEVANDICWRQT